jgi:hypothetical protein
MPSLPDAPHSSTSLPGRRAKMGDNGRGDNGDSNHRRADYGLVLGRQVRNHLNLERSTANSFTTFSLIKIADQPCAVLK